MSLSLPGEHLVMQSPSPADKEHEARLVPVFSPAPSPQELASHRRKGSGMENLPPKGFHHVTSPSVRLAVHLPPQTPGSRSDELVCGLRLPTFNVYIVSLSFLVLFSAFNPIQSFVTSMLGDGLGNESLTICYGTVTAVVLFVPAVVNVTGEPLAMLLGGFGYCQFMIALLFPTKTVLLTCSVILGCGSALLWVVSTQPSG